jgi:hypothetical protein
MVLHGFSPQLTNLNLKLAKPVPVEIKTAGIMQRRHVRSFHPITGLGNRSGLLCHFSNAVPFGTANRKRLPDARYSAIYEDRMTKEFVQEQSIRRISL